MRKLLFKLGLAFVLLNLCNNSFAQPAFCKIADVEATCRTLQSFLNSQITDQDYAHALSTILTFYALREKCEIRQTYLDGFNDIKKKNKSELEKFRATLNNVERITTSGNNPQQVKSSFPKVIFQSGGGG